MVFEFATGAFIGTEHLLRPDIYERGKPAGAQQPGGVPHKRDPRHERAICSRRCIYLSRSGWCGAWSSSPTCTAVPTRSRIVVALSQEVVAELSGATRPSINQVLRSLQEREIVALG